MTAFAVGSLVRFHTPANQCERETIYRVAEDRGDRVLVDCICEDMNIIPQTVFATADLEPATICTLAQFQATRRAVSDLASELGIDASYFEDESRTPRKAAGFVYTDDCYIDLMEDGRFHLILFRDEYVSDNLGELEDKLFQWCIDERCFGDGDGTDASRALVSRAAAAARVEFPAIASQLRTTDADALLTTLRTHEDEARADVAHACAAIASASLAGGECPEDEARAEVDAYVERVHANRR